MAQIADVIKYEGDNSTFIWKHPCEDFNSMTQLIVHESQEAVFFMNGEALDLFGPGRYTLETQNVPKIGKLLNRTTGGETPFHCEVYFINKTVQMAVKWGTDSKVRFTEPAYGLPIEIGACGEMNVAVSDSRKLLIKLVGTMNGIAWGDSGRGFTKSLTDSFRPLISTAVKANLARCIKDGGIDILNIDSYLPQLSEVLKQSILPGFEEYGVTIPQFYVTTVMLPENDPNFKRMKEIHTVALQTGLIGAEKAVKTAIAQSEAEITAAERAAVLEREKTETERLKREAEREIIRAQAGAEAAKISGFAEAEVMRAKGYTEKDVMQAEVQKAYAEGIGNMHISGGGGVAGDVIGLGVGMAAAGAVSSQLGGMFKGAIPGTAADAASDTAACPACGASIPANAKFCPECGAKKAQPAGADTVVCPECGKTVAKGKFCPECGHRLSTVCPGCGKETAPGAKFCPECGQKL